jgi:hypothetical protein
MEINMKNQRDGTTPLILIIFVIFVLGGIGWIKNIIHLTNCDFEAPYKAEAIYSVGLIPVLGAVIGWINIEDGPQNESE